MNAELLYGAAIGNVVLMLCCLVGLIMVAVHARGRTRWFAVAGFVLILLSRLVSMAVAALSLTGPAYGAPTSNVVVSLLPAVIAFLGLISLALALVRRAPSPKEPGAVS